MSLGYSIISELYTEFNTENITAILKKGEKLGFAYYEFIPGEYNTNNSPFTIEEVVKCVFSCKEDQLPWILSKINDTQLTMHFIRFPLGTSIMFNNFTYPWIKSFDDKEDIDIGKYTQLMLNLIEDYKIFKIVVEKD